MTHVPAVAGSRGASLGDGEVALIDAYWRAANYLSVGQIYLLDNALRAASWAIRSRTLSAPRSTIPNCWSRQVRAAL